MDILKQFENYYRTRSPSIDLIESIKNYDFLHFQDLVLELERLKSKHLAQEKTTTVHSNGSSGDSVSSYVFGPDFSFWCPQIEKTLRNHEIQIRLTWGTKDTDQCCFIRPFLKQTNKEEYSIFLNLTDQNNRLQLIDLVKNISDRHNTTVSLCAKPTTWLFLSTDQTAHEELTAIKPILKSLINEDWEPWIKQNLFEGVHFNDQMIDWKTGANFYTCQKGNKHFLPIFSINSENCTNLLNLAMDAVHMTDEFQITEDRKLCSCGRYYMPFKFRSQGRFNPHLPRSIINNLSSSYRNLQFLRNDSTKVYYSCNGEFKDKDVIASNIKGKIEFVQDQQFYVGRKKYNFWSHNRELSVVPHPATVNRRLSFI